MTKILIVEDEPASLKILRYFLGRQGYKTAGAKDGLEALELFSQSRYDLVLSDLKMPRMDGLALAQRILSTIPLTPCFLMTADDSIHTKRSGSSEYHVLSNRSHWKSYWREFRR